MKDFYDLLVLSRQSDFDGATLRSAIQRTFANRSTHVQAMPIALTVAFAGDVTKQTQWEGFLHKTQLDNAPTSLQSVIDELTRTSCGPSQPQFRTRYLSQGDGYRPDHGKSLETRPFRT